MILYIDSNAAYLVLPHAQSRMAGHFFLGPDPSKSPATTSNGPISTKCKTICHVASSAAEAETAALFHNAQAARPIRYMLVELGHLQPPSSLKTDIMQQQMHSSTKL